ncbi:GIP, partial [Symbiodinium microadriaticum]
FKTSSGVGQAVNTLPSQKRAADDNAQECSQRDQVRRRLDVPLQQPVHEITDLSVPVWEPIFQSAQSCATKVTPILVPPQHNVIAAISQALPQYQVLQVFAALGGKSLHHPLGALPSPVAPWRITFCSRRDSQGNMTYQCLGTDDRTTMPSERRRQRIAPTSFMLTVFAQKRLSDNTEASNAESTSVQSNRTTAPDLEGWGPPPVPLHGPAFRSLTREDKQQGKNQRWWTLRWTFSAMYAWNRPSHGIKGRLERHGDILKDMLARLDIESPIVNDTALDQVLQQAVLAKNSLIRHGGFSPEQIVFGKSLRVPGSVSSDEEAPAHALSEGTDLESEMFRQKLELRCRARRAFMDADNSQAIRRKSVIWLAHGTNIIRAAPENLRPASLREWQHLSDSQLEEPLKNVGGASTFLDLTGSPSQEPPESVRAASFPPVSETAVLMPQPGASTAVEPAPNSSIDEVPQPEQELTPQVSQEASGVERDSLSGTAAPSDSVLDSAPPETTLQPQDIPVPDSEDGLASDYLFMALEESGITDEQGCELIHFTTVEASPESVGPPLAEDNLPYVLEPLQLAEHQAFCLEVPLKVKDMRHWMREGTSEHLATVAAASKRARAEVCVKDLTRAEQELFEKAKAKVCELLGNAYGRVDAPLLFYKELSKQTAFTGS